MPTSMDRSLVRCVPSGWERLSQARLRASRGRGGGALSQRQHAISVGHHRFAMLAKGGVAAAVAHDPADLLALDIAVDAGHPRIDLGEQQALARRNDVV